MVSVRESQGGAIKASMKFHAVTSCRCWSISLWADAVSHAALTISRYILSIKAPTRFTVIRQLHDSVSGVSNLWRAAVVVRDSITSSDSLLKTCKTVKQKVSCSQLLSSQHTGGGENPFSFAGHQILALWQAHCWFTDTHKVAVIYRLFTPRQCWHSDSSAALDSAGSICSPL